MTTLPFTCVERNPLVRENRVTRQPEGRFIKRKTDLERYIPSLHLRETYLVMLQFVSLTTRTSFTSVEEIARARRVDARTIRRHLGALSRLKVIQITPRRAGCRSNYTNRYTFPLLNESFLMYRLMSAGGGAGVRVKPLPEIKKQATTAAAVASAGVHTPRTWKPDPERPRPSLEAEQSRRKGREMRRTYYQSRQDRKAQAEMDACVGTPAFYRAMGYDLETQTPETAAWLASLVITDNGGER